MIKSPEEIQRDASELIQRYEAEKAAAEALTEKYKKSHMEKLKMGYLLTSNDWDISDEDCRDNEDKD